MRKTIRILSMVLLTMPFFSNAQLKPADAVPQMMRGINLGNTMEAPNEGAWNAPIKEYYFDDIKGAGFTTVRIPINWWNHTSKTAPYTIDAAWLNRVEQVVDWGLARGLFIVINTHHEEELFNNFDAYLPMYVSIWSQIANRLKSKSDHLLFELLNEPHGKPTVANLNDFNSRVLKAIRPSNPTRLVVYSGNQWANSYNLIDKNLNIPNPADNYLMGYYHSYDPIGFGLSGNGTFGTDADKQGIWNKMKSVANWSAGNGIPAYLGEFGAVSSGDLNSRFRYYATNVDYAISNNLPFMVWDNGGDYQVYNRGGRKYNEIKDILVNFYPQSPTNFTAVQQGGIVLNWTNRVTGANSISVQRKLTTADSYTTIATISASATTYSDYSAPAGTYFYRVIANVSASLQYYGYPQQITSTGTPTLAINLTANKTSLCPGQSATLTAAPVVSSGTITKVEFYEGLTLLSTDITAPYTYSVANTGGGTRSISAKATASTGAAVTSSPVTITQGTGTAITPYLLVNNGLWTSDVAATVCQGSSVMFGPQPLSTVGWSWRGPNGFTATTREVFLYMGSASQGGVYTATYDDGSGCTTSLDFTLVVNSASAPLVSSPVAYAVNDVPSPLSASGANLNWYTVSAGGISLAGAPVPSTSTAGNTSYYVSQTQNGCESARVKIDVVVTGNNQLPTIALTSPIGGLLITAPGVIELAATASDADGSISKVEFYNGTTLLATDATAPYSFTWTNVAAGTYALTAKATDNSGGVALSDAVSVVVVAPANVLPVINVTSPLATTAYTAPASVVITASASDADGSISKVEFYNGATLLATDATAPYSVTWANVAAGTYALTAKATDNSGGVATSSAVSIVVNIPINVAPVVNLTSPANKAVFTAPASVTISATATDADGMIAKVEFYNGTTLLATDATAPYSFAWTNVAAGTYSISAKAYDNSNAVSSSSIATVTVNPVVSTADIIGPDCGSNNTTMSFSLNPNLRANVTAYNWWYTGSAASTSIVAGSPFSATMQTGGYFSAGQVCVGVNMSVSPFYKQYCKSITKCAGARTEDADMTHGSTNAQTAVFPNPFSQDFVIKTVKSIDRVSVVNELGNEVYHMQTTSDTYSVSITGKFNQGMYLVKISYTDGSQEMKSIIKVD